MLYLYVYYMFASSFAFSFIRVFVCFSLISCSPLPPTSHTWMMTSQTEGQWMAPMVAAWKVVPVFGMFHPIIRRLTLSGWSFSEHQLITNTTTHPPLEFLSGILSSQAVFCDHVKVAIFSSQLFISSTYFYIFQWHVFSGYYY